MDIGAAGYICFGGRTCLDACQTAILQCQYDRSGLKLHVDCLHSLLKHRLNVTKDVTFKRCTLKVTNTQEQKVWKRSHYNMREIIVQNLQLCPLRLQTSDTCVAA